MKENMKQKWQPVIGLEIHAQLNTKSKLFSGASTAYGATPNSQACLVDLAYPGVLPVLNQKALEFAIRFGLAIGAKIENQCIFARKNYFYPDLPKGYQISQFDQPIVSSGYVEVARKDGSFFRVNIERAHLEEDAGKSVHDCFESQTGIDLNRAGVPLIEIVSKPDLFSTEDAVAYARWVHTLVKYLGICDGNMQEGSFRCDANVSIRPFESDVLGTRAEIKNLNSFRFLTKAINYEITRQIDLIESGAQVVQETRLYNMDQDETRPMRSKENANDYRYFTDPDLLPVLVPKELIQQVKNSLPELPDEKKKRFQSDFKLSVYEASVLVSEKALADYFESVIKKLNPSAYQMSANWVMVNLLGFLNKHQLCIDQSPILPNDLAELIGLIEKGVISSKIAKEVFELMAKTGEKADQIVEKKGLKQVSDESEIIQIVEQVIEENTNQFNQYKAGKEKLFGFFVGQVMKKTQGKANPQTVNHLLKKRLS